VKIARRISRFEERRKFIKIMRIKRRRGIGNDAKFRACFEI